MLLFSIRFRIFLFRLKQQNSFCIQIITNFMQVLLSIACCIREINHIDEQRQKRVLTCNFVFKTSSQSRLTSTQTETHGSFLHGSISIHRLMHQKTLFQMNRNTGEKNRKVCWTENVREKSENV